MGLRINTNVTSMSALRNLGRTNDDTTMSINRLSTGLRITTAADDPAGLIISEGMRAQIKGLEQAIRNSQDAVNMAKTAEGSLDEAQKLLRDIRAIAVHSANTAVVDSAQLQADQQEIRSTIQSLARIADSTQWGTRKLLNGTAGTLAVVTDALNVANAYFGSNFNGSPVANGPITVTRTAPAAQTALVTDKTFAAPTTVPTAGTVVINGYSFAANGSTDTLQNVADRINAQSPNTGVSATVQGTAPNLKIGLTSIEYGAGFPIDFFDPSGVLNTTVNPAPTTPGANATATVTLTVQSPSGPVTSSPVTFTGGQGKGVSGLMLTDGQGNSLKLTPAGNAGTGLATASAVGNLTAGNLRFQIGANSNQSVSFGMPDVRPQALGTGAIAGRDMTSLDVTTQQGALDAMAIIDSAITQLSQMRGDLGSFQKNFLESTVRTLDIARENFTAAESTIRDADIAEEMSKYTRLQILGQSGTAVLAQANQMPQQVLKLLQG